MATLRKARGEELADCAGTHDKHPHALPSALPGGTKTTRGTLRRIQALARAKRSPFNACNDHLRDAIAAANGERFAAVIDEDDADRSAIVGVNRSGRVQTGDAVPDRKTAARANLCFDSDRQRDTKTGRHERSLARDRKST